VRTLTAKAIFGFALSTTYGIRERYREKPPDNGDSHCSLPGFNYYDGKVVGKIRAVLQKW
jgi:hypothetical protein